MRTLRTGFAVAALAAAAAAIVSSCGQTPTNVPIHTFEGAQKAAVLCLEVNDPVTGIAVPIAKPVPESYCAPVPAGVVGSALPYHLIAVVTQTRRGEMAVVDVTAGYVVDQDEATPGINFIPVGTNPTDVVVAAGNNPDTVYVSSASATKPAIFAIPSSRLMGNSTNVKTPPLLLTDLEACSLPQPPLALAVVSLSNPSVSAGVDGGSVAEGGVRASDAGVSDGGAPADYRLLVLLAAQAGAPAKIVVVDPTPLVAGHAPGALPACALVGNGLMLSASMPSSWSAGPAWSDGVPYVDGGVGDLSAHEPAVGPPGICSALMTADASAGDAGASPAPAAVEAGGAMTDGQAAEEADETDGGEGADAGDAESADSGGEAETDAPSGAIDGSFSFSLEVPSSPAPAFMLKRDDAPFLYVSDSAIPVIHVVDFTNPNALVERSPLVATSLRQPSRQVTVGALALSPPTRDYKRYLYAIDSSDGSLIVYDVTDPAGVASPHVPLVRPHSELNPFVPPDRLTFAAPVATVAFAQHDWPLVLPSATNASQQIAYQGLLCNPNPNAHPSATEFVDLGAYYRVDQAGIIQANATVQNFPERLRGVFGFATLTNGTVVAIDVDDWDAPCRRPERMSGGAITGSLDVPEPSPNPPTRDVDPYHAPSTYQYQPTLVESPAITLEQFFPVSAPHRLRSSVLLRNDSTNGNHLPNVTEPPELSDLNGTPVVTSGKAGVTQPVILPTALEPGFTDPTLIQNPTEPDPKLVTVVDAGAPSRSQVSPTPGVRLSFEDPTVHQSQDWTVTYEGVLPSSSGIFATITSTTAESSAAAYTTLDFATEGADLCEIGIEDWSTGQTRARDALAAMDPAIVSNAKDTLATLPQWTADYVEITDDILPQDDPYWTLPNQCWNRTQASEVDGGVDAPAARYELCAGTFGTPGSNPDLDVNRDAPILAAYADHLIVGRFGHSSPIERTQNRTIDPGSPNNPTFLSRMACCFHKQAAFKIRAGGEWIAVGQQNIGLLHHVVATPSSAPDANRCVLSCDPRAKLLNARSFDVPWAQTSACEMPLGIPSIDRNSPLAMRNPMFSYVTWAGCGGMLLAGDHTTSARDLTWKFSINGGFSPLTIPIAGATGAAVSPQSMLFITSLGQLAVVDGADQGLVLIDLNTVSFSTNYF